MTTQEMVIKPDSAKRGKSGPKSAQIRPGHAPRQLIRRAYTETLHNPPPVKTLQRRRYNPQSNPTGFCVHGSGHAKNTNTANNSDIDITISPFVILHAAVATSFHFTTSAWVYATPGGAPAPVTAPGSWVSVSASTILLFPNSGMAAFPALGTLLGGTASVANLAGYGIEHIPTPMGVVTGLLGLGLISIGRVRRQWS